MISTAQVERARNTPIGEVIDARGIRLRGGIEQVGPCPICGGNDRFAVNIRKNLFNCRGCNASGDAIALVQLLDGCGFAEAVVTLAGEIIKATRAPISHPIPKPDTSNIEYERAQRRKSRYLFEASMPATGTPAETYLRSRGITATLPATVRFLAPTGDHHPAVLLPFGIPDEIEPGALAIEATQISAVQLILLKPDGSGKVETKPNKLTIGSPAGLPLVLAPMNDLLGLAICEGAEDALSVHQGTGLGAWAAGGAGFMPKLITAIKIFATREEDASPECVTIYADDNSSGQRGARQLAELLIARGIETLVNGLAP